MKKRAVKFSDTAEQDLRNLYEWLADKAGPYIAFAFVQRITTFTTRFDLASKRGTRRDDISKGLRIVGFERRVTIAFTVEDTQVTILRIFYGGKDWEEEWNEDA